MKFAFPSITGYNNTLDTVALAMPAHPTHIIII